jgi:phosphatase NudJ
MPRDPIPTWFFVKVVVRQDDRFLLVHERKFDQTWHVPSGRVEPGEAFYETALRETLEETGVPVVLDGVLRLEHNPQRTGSFVGAILLAHPAADVPPKTTPDEESLGAAWFRLEQLADLPMREPAIRDVLAQVQAGVQVYPLSVIAPKGVPLDRAD